MFCYLVCASVCSWAANKSVIQLAVCVLRVLTNVPRCGIINLNRPTALRNLNSQDDEDPLTKSLATIAENSCSLTLFLRFYSCVELQLAVHSEMVYQKYGNF